MYKFAISLFVQGKNLVCIDFFFKLTLARERTKDILYRLSPNFYLFKKYIFFKEFFQ